MGVGIWNMAFGLFCIVAGATGKLTLIGTNSTEALAGVGVLMSLWGASQMWRSRKRDEGTPRDR